MKINGHGHVLPEPEDIPAFMRDKEVFWIDQDRRFMYQKNWRRPITDPSFFVSEKIAWMDRQGIDHAVILNLSQLYCNGMEAGLAKDVLRFQNDFNASLKERFPRRLTGGFVVQLGCIDTALAEIERCVTELHMPLLCLPTSFPG